MAEKIVTASEKGIALIKQYEGFEPECYYCPAYKLTIGYGHVIKKTDRFRNSMTGAQLISIAQTDLAKAKKACRISEDEATFFLREDVKSAESTILRYVKVPLKQHQFDALVSFIYNVGAEKFLHSTLLLRLKALKYQEAATEFQRWVYCQGKKLKGLILRRQAEEQLFRGIG